MSDDSLLGLTNSGSGGTSGAEGAAEPKPINGVLTALVTETKDDQGWGRVKVKFLGQGIDKETELIPVASYAAGKDRGAFFPLEKDDRVLVSFIQGDINRPVVIGVLWGKTDAPPDKNADGKCNVRIFKSRSGHTITFDDNAQEKKEKLELKTNAGHVIVMDDANSKEKVEIKTKAGHKITMDDSPGGEKIEIKDKGGGSIKMDATGKSITIKSTQITIEASASLTLKGAAIKAEASGITEVKGSMVKIN